MILKGLNWWIHYHTGDCRMDISVFLGIWILLGVLLWHESLGCMEEEKIGLLKLKASLNHPSGSAFLLGVAI